MTRVHATTVAVESNKYYIFLCVREWAKACVCVRASLCVCVCGVGVGAQARACV